MQPAYTIDDTIIIALLVGGLITWLVTWLYYQRASQDLRAESTELRKETELVRRYVDALITYLVEEGQMEQPPRDSTTGRPIATQFIQGGGIESTDRNDSEPTDRVEEDTPSPREWSAPRKLIQLL